MTEVPTGTDGDEGGHVAGSTDDLERTPDPRVLLVIVVIVLAAALAAGVGWR